MMAHDQHLLWTTKGTKASKDNMDPNSLHIFFNSANTGRPGQGRPIQRVKSAAPRIGGRHPGGKEYNKVNASPLGSHSSFFLNPSPTPATSRPLSSRSGRSSYSSVQKNKQEPSASPTSLYLQLHKARCKSAPPRPADYYLPQKSKSWQSRGGSTSSLSQSAPKRAWQNRTSSAKSQHSLMSQEEVEKRHRERCKSAPLPYDFSSIEVVNCVPKHGSDIQRLKAFTRPLTCMPDVIQNVLSHNGLRHCCSAYQPRPKSSPSRQQFWPVARPTVFQRGDVPKYLHFVKPAGFWVRGEGGHLKTGPDDDLSLLNDNQDVLARADFPLNYEDDLDETVLFEEQFIVPASPSEASSEREYSLEPRDEELQTEQDLDATHCEGLAEKYLGDDEKNWPDNQVTLEPPLEKPPADIKTSDADPVEPVLEIIITKLEPDKNSSPEINKEEQKEAGTKEEGDSDIQIDVPEIPQWATEETLSPTEDVRLDDVKEEVVMPETVEEPAQIEKELEKEVENEPVAQKLNDIPQKTEVEMPKPQTHQVKFSDSLILTSFKSPLSKEEEKEQVIKPILKPTVSKAESPTLKREEPKVASATQKRTTPLLERKVVEKPPLLKPPPVAPVQPVEEIKTEEKNEEKRPEEEEKVAEEREEVAPKLEPEVLPKPEYIRAPGAYRMYDPKDLLEYRLEQKREARPLKKSLTNSSMPRFVPSVESTEVITSIMDERKQRKEGMKPWLQGRLALSKQTSRFELPMDVKLLEEMTPMEYLTKYCIISTRRKALYKHIFQKVDKDRDNQITFKEMDKGLREIHVDSISTEQVKKLIEMVEGNEKSTFSLAQFSAIAAFSERFLFSETQVTEKNNPYSSKEIIEEADFCGLKSKLSGFPVNPTVRKILEVL